MNKTLVTGSYGLIGSAAVKTSHEKGHHVIGIDNGQRGKWFGSSNTSVASELNKLSRYSHYNINLLDNEIVESIVGNAKPTTIIHTAGQPSHDYSAEIPVEDFRVNALATVQLLEAARKYCPGCTFIYTSTNKVYGHLTDNYETVDETYSIDRTTHTPMGVSKLAADLMVQEYGNYFGMLTACFRLGCVTGKAHQGVECHGYLAYLCDCLKTGKKYNIYGYGGHQVRDNIHVSDVISAFVEFCKKPTRGAVYNLGGGHDNAASMVQIIEIAQQISGKKLKYSLNSQRRADHRWYVTDNSHFKEQYPDWKITVSLHQILEELLN